MKLKYTSTVDYQLKMLSNLHFSNLKYDARVYIQCLMFKSLIPTVEGFLHLRTYKVRQYVTNGIHKNITHFYNSGNIIKID